MGPKIFVGGEGGGGGACETCEGTENRVQFRVKS